MAADHDDLARIGRVVPAGIAPVQGERIEGLLAGTPVKAGGASGIVGPGLILPTADGVMDPHVGSIGRRVTPEFFQSFGQDRTGRLGIAVELAPFRREDRPGEGI